MREAVQSSTLANAVVNVPVTCGALSGDGGGTTLPLHVLCKLNATADSNVQKPEVLNSEAENKGSISAAGIHLP